MKGGARCNNTSCVNTSEKNWLWWRVVRDVTIHHVSLHQKRIDYDEGWCAMWQYIMCQYIRKELTMMKGGARCNNTSCVNTSEKNWLWWRVVRDVTIHHVSLHQKRIDYDEGWCARMGSGEEGKWWWRGVVKKGSDDEGKWWRREVMMKGSGEEGKWWRREVVKKGSGDEGKECWGLHGICGGRSHWNGYMNVAWAMLWGGSRSTKPCVFPCKVAAGDDERYLVCAAGAAAVVWFLLCVLQEWLFLCT